MSRQPIAQLKQRAGTFTWGRAVELDDIRGEVAITGVGETPYTGPSQRDCKQMALEAVASAIADAGLLPREVDGLMVHFGVADQITPEDFHQYFGTSHDLWFSDQGGAMVWAATCCHTAAHALAHDRDIVRREAESRMIGRDDTELLQPHSRHVLRSHAPPPALEKERRAAPTIGTALT